MLIKLVIIVQLIHIGIKGIKTQQKKLRKSKMNYLKKKKMKFN